MTDRYAVVGNPVAHSLSPRIHAAFAAATGQALTYETLVAPLDGFVETAERFFAGGGAGLNVTVPFKETAARWVHELDPAARSAGAVNTIASRSDGHYCGYNTDGAGLVRDLTGNYGMRLAGAGVLLLGAGGAARGVVRPLLAERPQRLVVANRTVERAAAVAEAVRREDPDAPVRGVGLVEAAGGFDLVVNATSAGLGAAAAVADVDPAVAVGALCYDMIYPGHAGQTTPFCRWAAGHGARGVADGLGMLVEQAALAFELWRGVAPETAPVLELLRRGDV